MYSSGNSLWGGATYCACKNGPSVPARSVWPIGLAILMSLAPAARSTGGEFEESQSAIDCEQPVELDLGERRAIDLNSNCRTLIAVRNVAVGTVEIRLLEKEAGSPVPGLRWLRDGGAFGGRSLGSLRGPSELGYRAFMGQVAMPGDLVFAAALPPSGGSAIYLAFASWAESDATAELERLAGEGRNSVETCRMIKSIDDPVDETEIETISGTETVEDDEGSESDEGGRNSGDKHLSSGQGGAGVESLSALQQSTWVCEEPLPLIEGPRGDFFTFEVEVGGVIVVEFEGPQELVGRIYSIDGALLAEESRSPTEVSDSQLFRSLPAGRYLLEISWDGPAPSKLCARWARWNPLPD